jgi:cytochrome oxidase Cu insertion factor (SCO1/SenC/PrrC family)
MRKLRVSAHWLSTRHRLAIKITMSLRSVGYDFVRRVLMRRKMRNVLAASLLGGALVICGVGSSTAQTKPAGGETRMPKVGDMAPDFTLNYFDGNDLKAVSLSQYRGKKNVVVAFFIFAFTGG